jgi:hypothetical protein
MERRNDCRQRDNRYTRVYCKQAKWIWSGLLTFNGAFTDVSEVPYAVSEVASTLDLYTKAFND